jgi:Amt family ammonium transporter
MKKLLMILALGLAALGFGAPPGAGRRRLGCGGVRRRRRRQMPPAAAAAAPAPAASKRPPRRRTGPVPNKGDVSWMLVSTLLVIMMAVPGLALFYGGLVRSKNMLSVLMQVFVTFSLIVVLWVVYGYSLAFTEGNAFIGGFDRLFLKGIFDPATGTFAMGATFSKGVVIPEIVFVAFQATFAAITCGLIVGAFAERMKFRRCCCSWCCGSRSATRRWRTWCGSGWARTPTPGKEVVDAMNAKAGLIWQWGALDFAGGTVVHINAAVAGLVGAYMIGKRVGYGKRVDGAAQPDADHGRCLAAVGGLVRLQRRLGARSRQQRCAGLHEHLLGHGGGGAGLVHRRVRR